MTLHLDQELSAYLDGELDGAERTRVESHLAACTECRRTLEELRQLTRRAAALDDRPPVRDLWAGIADRMATPDTADVVPLASRRRRVSFSIPQLAAAAVALMALSAGVVALATRDRAPVVAAAPDTGLVVRTAALPAGPMVASYDVAIRELQQAIAVRRTQLDTATVRVIEQSLEVIDVAVAQARAALERDPNNRYLNGHLQRALDRKLELLRTVATLPAAS